MTEEAQTDIPKKEGIEVEITKDSVTKFLKRAWHFLWHEESFISYVAFIVIAFVLLRFVFFLHKLWQVTGFCLSHLVQSHSHGIVGNGFLGSFRLQVDLHRADEIVNSRLHSNLL